LEVRLWVLLQTGVLKAIPSPDVFGRDSDTYRQSSG
jgi:hypothetical protein